MKPTTTLDVGRFVRLDDTDALAGAVRASCNWLATGGDKPDQQAEEFRRLARVGDPFSLVGYQWPELLIGAGDPDAAFFEGEPGDPFNPCLRLDSWQRDILRSFFDDSIREIFVKGCTKAGKGASVGIAVNAWFDAFDATKIILSSKNYKHAKKNIFGEVAKWRRAMRSSGSGVLQTDGIADVDQHYAMVVNPTPTGGEGYSGAHGPRTLFVFDEASGIPDILYENSQKQASKIVALSNPRTLSGWFYNGFSAADSPNKTQTVLAEYGRRRLVTVSGKDCMNVKEGRLERPISPPTGVEIDGRRYEPGEEIASNDFEKVRPLIPDQCDSARYQGTLRDRDPRKVDVFAHGFFPEEDPESQVILPSHLQRHIDAWREDLPVVAFGLDIGRSKSGDKTALAVGGSEGCLTIYAWQKDDVVFHYHRVLRLAKNHGIDLTKGRNPVCIDMVFCAGLGDMLKNAGVWVIEFRGNQPAEVDPKTHANLRAESYALLGTRLDPYGYFSDQAWALPKTHPDLEAIRQELTAPEKVYGRDGLRFHISPKRRVAGHAENVRTVQDKIGRSPDLGDAVVYLHHAVARYENWNELFERRSRPLVLSPLTQEEREAAELEETMPELPDADDQSEPDDEPDKNADVDLFAYTVGTPAAESDIDSSDPIERFHAWATDRYGEQDEQEAW